MNTAMSLALYENMNKQMTTVIGKENVKIHPMLIFYCISPIKYFMKFAVTPALDLNIH